MAQPRLFGEIAIDMGFIRRKDLRVALDFQRSLAERGRYVLMLGAILVGLGCMTPEQVLKVLEGRQTSVN